MRIHIIRVHPAIEDITWVVAISTLFLNIEIYAIIIIITVNSIKVNYGCAHCRVINAPLNAHPAFFKSLPANSFFLFRSQTSPPEYFFHCWSMVNWKELSLLAVLGIVRAQTLTVTVTTPGIPCVPTPINPSVLLTALSMVTGRLLRIFMICGLRRLSP